jgi:hypothetical protein
MKNNLIVYLIDVIKIFEKREFQDFIEDLVFQFLIFLLELSILKLMMLEKKLYDESD